MQQGVWQNMFNQTLRLY